MKTQIHRIKSDSSTIKTTTTKTTEQALRKRIWQCSSWDELHILDKKIERHYENDTINANAFGRLAVLIMERTATIEEKI